MRKTIARRMTEAWQTIPHVTLHARPSARGVQEALEGYRKLGAHLDRLDRERGTRGNRCITRHRSDNEHGLRLQPSQDKPDGKIRKICIGV